MGAMGEFSPRFIKALFSFWFLLRCVHITGSHGLCRLDAHQYRRTLAVLKPCTTIMDDKKPSNAGLYTLGGGAIFVFLFWAFRH
jgi:hypothetical protein